MSYPWTDAATWTAAGDGADELLADPGTANADTTWCTSCLARSTFTILLDHDEGWTYWRCDRCGEVAPVCPWHACGCGHIIDCKR